MHRIIAALLAIALAAPALAQPKDQAAFYASADSYRYQWTYSANDLKRAAMPAERETALRQALGDSLRINGWTLYVLSVSIDPTTGRPWIALVSNLSPTPAFILMTLSDANDVRRLALDADALAVARTLDIRDRVVVDGELVLNDRGELFEYERDAGDSIAKSMTAPKFALRISSLRKLPPEPAAKIRPESRSKPAGR